MDKKFILICIVALVLSVGAVSAVNLENKNFDDAFSMKVPKNSNFSIQAMNQSAGFNFSSNLPTTTAFNPSMAMIPLTDSNPQRTSLPAPCK